ncbi:SRR1-like protein [Psilocybe cubensis]|uniref:SRR1-like protein n=2 Tax=Psilocybe cubensis TaxID=181762 RepID=A0ACB8H862_PSICU|nr:SRR1-like protein [Psilocybe cubensis]KAH9484029.1 SRR1-like protein [Psilocybe cubensis]
MNAHSFAYSDFIPVKSRKNRNRKGKSSPPLSTLLAALQEQLRQEEWFAQCSRILDSSWSGFSAQKPAVLCLGLGSPSSSLVARVQLAFLTETCKRLDIAADSVSLYDPIFTTEDTALFEELQMNVLSKNRDTESYSLSVPTICFMPHCDIELYDTLLRANWNKEGLSNLFLLGNQLQEYLDNKPASVLETSVPFLLRAAPALDSQPFPIASAWPTAFNNMSAQCVSQSRPGIVDLLLAAPASAAAAGASSKPEKDNSSEETLEGESCRGILESARASSPRPT